MLTLDSDQVGARETERGAQELLNEFYKAFFNGQPHATQIEPTPVTFPICDLFFNQTQLPAPADKPQLHTVFTDMRAVERWWSSTEKLVTAECTLSIFVRTSNQGAEGNKADFLCRKTADQVKEIFQSQDRYALAQKGVRHPKVMRGPLPVGTIGFQVRLLIVSCELQYKIPRTGA
jgi:hypothetical protein